MICAGDENRGSHVTKQRDVRCFHLVHPKQDSPRSYKPTSGSAAGAQVGVDS